MHVYMNVKVYICFIFILVLFIAIITQLHLESRLKKEQRRNSIPHLCLHGMLLGQRFALPNSIQSRTVVSAADSTPCELLVLFQYRD